MSRHAAPGPRRIWITTTLALAILGPVLAGCSSTGSLGRQAVTGPPVGPSFVAGKGVQVFAASPTVMSDVPAAMTDAGIHSIKQSREPDNTDVFEGTTADNRRAQVAVQSRGSKVVVTTRIGWRGDEPLSRAVLDRLTFRQGGTGGEVARAPITPAPAPVLTPAPAPVQSPLDGDAAPTGPGVPDSVMMRSQLESGYGQSPMP